MTAILKQTQFVFYILNQCELGCCEVAKVVEYRYWSPSCGVAVLKKSKPYVSHP